jgi:hypothetical protein
MFLLQRQPLGDASSLAYLFGCGGKGKAIAVDVHQEDPICGDRNRKWRECYMTPCSIKF